MKNKYLYPGRSSILYQTALYGGTDAILDNTSPVNSTDGYTSTIELTKDRQCNVEFKFSSVGGGITDDLTINMYKSLSGDFNGTEITLDTETVDNTGSELTFSYRLNDIDGAGYYRFSMQSSGATNTFNVLVTARTYTEEV